MFRQSATGFAFIDAAGSPHRLPLPVFGFWIVMFLALVAAIAYGSSMPFTKQ